MSVNTTMSTSSGSKRKWDAECSECPVCYESSDNNVTTDDACNHRICKTCYARLDECPLCRTEYLKLPDKLHSDVVSDLQTRKHMVYEEMRKLHDNFRNKEQEFLDLEDDLRDQVRVRVFHHSRMDRPLDTNDVLFPLVKGVLDFAQEHQRDPNYVWWSTTVYKAIVHEREYRQSHKRLRLQALLQQQEQQQTS